MFFFEPLRSLLFNSSQTMTVNQNRQTHASPDRAPRTLRMASIDRQPILNASLLVSVARTVARFLVRVCDLLALLPKPRFVEVFVVLIVALWLRCTCYYPLGPFDLLWAIWLFAFLLNFLLTLALGATEDGPECGDVELVLVPVRWRLQFDQRFGSQVADRDAVDFQSTGCRGKIRKGVGAGG
jgi:hypothetical protein